MHRDWLGKDAADFAFLSCVQWAEKEQTDLLNPADHWAFRLHWVALCESEGRLLGDALNSNDVLQGRQQKGFVLAQYLVAQRAGTLDIDQNVEAKFDLYQKWQCPVPMLREGHFVETYNSPQARAARDQAANEFRGMCTFEYFRTARPDMNPEALGIVQAYGLFCRDIPSHFGQPTFKITLDEFVQTRPDLAKAKTDRVVAEHKATEASRESFAQYVGRTGDIDFDHYEQSLRAGQKGDLKADL
jgi:hypothetical protein